jgi:hypothetical protein
MVASWILAVSLLVIGLPAIVGVRWNAVVSVVSALEWSSVCLLVDGPSLSWKPSQ